jgi:hypothetical protein
MLISALLFLDTKPGGFNLGNYGDEANINPSVNGFNFSIILVLLILIFYPITA